ncbi:hypothetical protein CC80DRAFT_490030 [Byssothecium circinans]|uniref:DUF7707 domain-containing protein n=1 Tax=Byssothecium circinans TaxID=147558 RepID=A0A6A5U5C1_9PLEO|nr:hypothetical protein CC80DRAFT_490030 [Byssothecium circinans]
MRSTIAFGLLAMAGFSGAQQQYSIDPNSVPKSTREYWCQMQKTQCPLICLQQPGVKSSKTIKNDCQQSDLSYSCVCDNNVSPNVTMYTQTMPFFQCQEAGNQCVKACNDNTCADKCRANHPCGAAEPFKGNATASSSSSTPAKTPGSSDTTSLAPAFGEATGSPQGNAASTFSTVGATYGMAITLISAFAGFALL